MGRGHPFPPTAAAHALRELHHVVLWAAFNYSTARDTIDMSAPFDPALAEAAAPLSRNEVVRLNELFVKKDEDHARQLAARDDVVRDLESSWRKSGRT